MGKKDDAQQGNAGNGTLSWRLPTKIIANVIGLARFSVFLAMKRCGKILLIAMWADKQDGRQVHRFSFDFQSPRYLLQRYRVNKAFGEES